MSGWPCIYCETINADGQEVCTGCGMLRERADIDSDYVPQGREEVNILPLGVNISPLGIVSSNGVTTIGELVEEYFPEGILMSNEDFEELRRTAYLLYQHRREMGYNDTTLDQAQENWKRAKRILAIRKYMREKTK